MPHELTAPGEDPIERLPIIDLVAGEGTDGTGRVAAGRLDLDDVGAEISKDAAAEEPLLVGQVQDAVGAQRAAGSGFYDGFLQLICREGVWSREVRPWWPFPGPSPR